MITIKADGLQDGLYNIKNGKIFKYKAGGGTVQTYEMGEVVTCKEPNAEVEPSWIPCSERLPEELSVVNVTYVNHDPEPYYDFVKDIASTETAVYYQGDWYWNWSGCVDVLTEYGRDDVNKVDKAVEVTAWMPLPEPWKGGTE